MPTTRRSRVLDAAPDRVWRVVGDVHHMPRWWPKVRRVEAVAGGRFTQVLRTTKGKDVRADYPVVED
ncbi:MAG TPA: SRPBCC family protein, partial [Solirubrobacteraceae bacterium]